MIELSEKTLFFPNLPAALDGLRILHATDLHTRGFGPVEQQLYHQMRQDCQMLVISGDCCFQRCLGLNFFRSNSCANIREKQASLLKLAAPPEKETALEVFGRLLDGYSCQYGIYAIQGNHDPDEFMEDLKKMPVNVLDNANTVLDINGAQLNLLGVNCNGREKCDIPQAVSQLLPDTFTIAITHYPELIEPLAAAGANLILAGHTHGGQICLPHRIPIITHSRTGRKYAAGLETTAAGYSYTSRGLGYCLPAIRIFCPPELGFVTLRRGNPDQTSISYSNIP